MKKSKVIIPAMALILFSTAASISGTVAWFTASRAFNTTVGDFAVVNTKDNLECVMHAGLGTTESDNIVSVISGKSLTDASFDHLTSDHFIIAPNADGDKVGKKVVLSTATFNDNATTGLQRETDIYSAFTWTMDFRLNMSATATSDVGLFFDAETSRMSKKVSLASGRVIPANTYYKDPTLTEAWSAGALDANSTAYTQNTTKGTSKSIAANEEIPAETYYTDAACTTYRAARGASDENDNLADTVYIKEEIVDTGIGFRIAFVGLTATYSNNRVWADLQSSSNCKHVLGGAAVGADLENAATTDDYDSPYLIDSANVSDPDDLTGARSVFTGSPLCLGYFHPGAGTTVTISFKCVAWFEGTDPHVVNTASTIYDTMTSYMNFKTVTLPAS